MSGVNASAAVDGSVTAQAIHAHLQQVFQPTRLEVLDESWQHEGHAGANGTGYGTHFRIRIAASALEGKRRVQQHRLVYDALLSFMAAGAHAIVIEIL